MRLILNRKGQATAEMAIMGAVVMMIFAYLLQQGYVHNARQALEMYTFREALQLSRQGLGHNRPVGISLTVVRDVVNPSFFTGVSRQRLMSSASVDLNPWIVYNATDDAGDMGTRQLFQMGEKMIRKGMFLEVPPSYVVMRTQGNDEDNKQWSNSAIRDVNSIGYSESDYDYVTNTRETPFDKTVTKDLMSVDIRPMEMRFENEAETERNYYEEDWTPPGDDDHILAADVSSVPVDMEVSLEETLTKVKTTTTPH